MTKLVRIENADTSSYKLIVERWGKAPPRAPGDTTPPEADILVETNHLSHPTQLLSIYVNSGCYLVIRESS